MIILETFKNGDLFEKYMHSNESLEERIKPKQSKVSSLDYLEGLLPGSFPIAVYENAQAERDLRIAVTGKSKLPLGLVTGLGYVSELFVTGVVSLAYYAEYFDFSKPSQNALTLISLGLYVLRSVGVYLCKSSSYETAQLHREAEKQKLFIQPAVHRHDATRENSQQLYQQPHRRASRDY